MNKHHKGKEGLKFPMGSGHWEEKVGDTEVADGKYCSEMGAKEEMKHQVNGLVGYVKKHKAKH